jgi:hypothetical protein
MNKLDFTKSPWGRELPYACTHTHTQVHTCKSHLRHQNPASWHLWEAFRWRNMPSLGSWLTSAYGAGFRSIWGRLLRPWRWPLGGPGTEAQAKEYFEDGLFTHTSQDTGTCWGLWACPCGGRWGSALTTAHHLPTMSSCWCQTLLVAT